MKRVASCGGPSSACAPSSKAQRSPRIVARAPLCEPLARRDRRPLRSRRGSAVTAASPPMFDPSELLLATSPQLAHAEREAEPPCMAHWWGTLVDSLPSARQLPAAATGVSLAQSPRERPAPPAPPTAHWSWPPSAAEGGGGGGHDYGHFVRLSAHDRYDAGPSVIAGPSRDLLVWELRAQDDAIRERRSSLCCSSTCARAAARRRRRRATRARLAAQGVDDGASAAPAMRAERVDAAARAARHEPRVGGRAARGARAQPRQPRARRAARARAAADHADDRVGRDGACALDELTPKLTGAAVHARVGGGGAARGPAHRYAGDSGTAEELPSLLVPRRRGRALVVRCASRLRRHR